MPFLDKTGLNYFWSKAKGQFIKSLSVSGKTITYTRGDGSTGTITTQDTNTDTLVKQSASTTTNYRPVLLGYTSSTDTTALTGTVTNQAYVATGLYFQPSTGTLLATKFSGNGAALTALNASNISSGTLAAARLPASGATAGSYGPSANASPAHGGTFSVPYLTVDAYGRVTAVATKTITLPADNNTDTKVTQTVTTTNAAYPLLLAPSGQTATTTGTAYFDSGVTLNPSTNTIAANVSGNAATATKLGTARTITLTGRVTGSASFDGSSAVTITASPRRAYAGYSVTYTSGCPWFKFASMSFGDVSAYADREITFHVSTGYSKYTATGILRAHFRTGSTGAIENAQLYWEYADSGIAISDFVMAYSTTTTPTIELWVSVSTSYVVYKFDVIQEQGRVAEGVNAWTLYTVTSGGAASITDGYTQKESTLLSLLNPVAKVGTATVGGTAKPIYLDAGTPTALSATVGSATLPVYMNAGTVTACGSSLAVSITGNAASATYATNARITATNPTSSTTYYLPFATGVTSGTNYVLRGNNGLRCIALEGTADADGYMYLTLGNSTASGTAGNKYGRLRVYGAGAYYTNLAFGTQTANRTITFPDATGTVALTSSNITGNAATATKLGTDTVGGTAKPIYLNAGAPTALSATVGSSTLPVFMNAGTITKCGTSLAVSVTGSAAKLATTAICRNATTTTGYFHVYTLEISTAYGGVAGQYAITDSEGTFFGIFGLKCRNSNGATATGTNLVYWLASSVSAPPTLTLTREVGDASITYRLYITINGSYKTYNISKINELGTAPTVTSALVTAIAGTSVSTASVVGSSGKVGTGTVGGTAKPVYLNAGVPTALSATVGSATLPVYLNAGTIMACGTSLAVGITGNAASATKLATAQTIDGVSFDGSAAIIHYGTCATAAGTAAKVVSCTGFTLVTGARISVKFTYANTATAPTLNVNSTGAKSIKIFGTTAPPVYTWAANAVAEFVYDGTYWQMTRQVTATPVKVTFTVAGWTKNATTGYYEQSVTCSGLLTTDDTRTRVEPVGNASDADAQALTDEAYAMIDYVACTTAGKLYARCPDGAPTVAFSVYVIITR